MNNKENTNKKAFNFIDRLSISNSVFVYFTVTAILAVLMISIALYSILSSQLNKTISEENSALVNQLNYNLDSYIRNIMKLSDSIYYGIIKNKTIDDNNIETELTLLYENNLDYVLNIAIISKDGKLIEAVPAARLKDTVSINNDSWFEDTLTRTENMIFSLPHVQNIFETVDNRYKWVISFSRAIEITNNGKSEQAVLLIDIDYLSLVNIMYNAKLGNNGYIYLIDSEGELIWHPKRQLIYSGLWNENNFDANNYSDGSYQEIFNGIKRNVIVKTVGYTGWKVIGVATYTALSLSSIKTRLFYFFAAGCIFFLVATINAYISFKITGPIKELENTVSDLENGKLPSDINIGGSYEVQHLGKSISSMSKQINKLMDDIVIESEAKRKNEFDALQSQINPHFLYNTLDIIVWMIENERQQEAVKAVTALARFFRISLSRGKNIITLKDEIEHIKNYLMIQHMRFKNKFTYVINSDPSIDNLSSLKLMLQPLVENSIYHGMEFKDGDGIIEVKTYKKDNALYIEVKDNGLGMTKERVESLLTSEHISSKRGQGIGIKNVHDRIRLYFGKEYGLKIYSEPDEGTVVTVKLPIIPYGELNE